MSIEYDIDKMVLRDDIFCYFSTPDREDRIEISRRLFNCMKRAGVNSLADAMKLSLKELRKKLKGFGSIMEQELMAVIEEARNPRVCDKCKNHRINIYVEYVNLAAPLPYLKEEYSETGKVFSAQLCAECAFEEMFINRYKLRYYLKG